MLLVIPAAMLGITLPSWFERHAAARAAADEAARAVAVADTWETGTAQAQTIVDDIARSYDLDPNTLHLEIDGTFARGDQITARVTVTMPAIDLPLIGTVGTFSRTITHTEPIDRYRSIDP
jgi:hypothetical protein